MRFNSISGAVTNGLQHNRGEDRCLQSRGGETGFGRRLFCTSEAEASRKTPSLAKPSNKTSVSKKVLLHMSNNHPKCINRRRALEGAKIKYEANFLFSSGELKDVPSLNATSWHQPEEERVVSIWRSGEFHCHLCLSLPGERL